MGARLAAKKTESGGPKRRNMLLEARKRNRQVQGRPCKNCKSTVSLPSAIYCNFCANRLAKCAICGNELFDTKFASTTGGPNPYYKQ